MPNCSKCDDTGIIDTGNNDLPCTCPAASRAKFNVTGVSGPVSGTQVKRHFLNTSPEPIVPNPLNPIPASSLRGDEE